MYCLPVCACIAWLLLGASRAWAACPPAAVFKCLNERAVHCELKHGDYRCLCEDKDEFLLCLARAAPYGNYLEARDHFLGTCIDRLPHLIDNPDYNMKLPKTSRRRTPKSAETTNPGLTSTTNMPIVSETTSFWSTYSPIPTDAPIYPPQDEEGEEDEEDDPCQCECSCHCDDDDDDDDNDDDDDDDEIDNPEKDPDNEHDCGDDEDDDDDDEDDDEYDEDGKFEDDEDDVNSPEEEEEEDYDNDENENDEIDDDNDDEDCDCHCVCTCDGDNVDDDSDKNDTIKNDPNVKESEMYTDNDYWLCTSSNPADCQDEDEGSVVEYLAYKKEYLSLPNQYQYGTEENEFWAEEKRARAEILNSMEKKLNPKKEPERPKKGTGSIDFKFATPELMHPQKRNNNEEKDQLDNVKSTSYRNSRKKAGMNSRKKQLQEEKRIRFGSSFLKTDKLPKAKPDEDCD